MANIVPALTQGANPVQSATNFKNWMDALATRHGGGQCLVHWDQPQPLGPRIDGLYHQMYQHTHQFFMSEITGLRAWGAQCANVNAYAGRLFSVEGSGMGSLTMVPLHIGPFE